MSRKETAKIWPHDLHGANQLAMEMLTSMATDSEARKLPTTLPGPTVDADGNPLPENDPRRKPQKFESFVPIVVDGGVAEALLLSNTVNRDVSPSNVDRLAREIYNNNWKFNGNSAVLPCSNTAIMDRQHTFMGVRAAFERARETGHRVKPIIMIPVIGLEPAVFTTIDDGKGRTTKDTLTAAERIEAIDMGEVTGTVWSFALRLLGQYTNMMEELDPSHPLYMRGLRDKMPNARAAELFNMAPQLQESIRYCHKIGVPQTQKALVPMAVLGMLHAIISEVQSNSAANSFVKSLAHGTGLDETSPIYQLREQLIRDKGATRKGPGGKRVRMEGIELLAMCVRTWNNVAMHRTANGKRVRAFNADHSFPTPLPMQRRSAGMTR